MRRSSSHLLIMTMWECDQEKELDKWMRGDDDDDKRERRGGKYVEVGKIGWLSSSQESNIIITKGDDDNDDGERRQQHGTGW